MSTRKLLNNLIKIRDDIIEHGPSERRKVARRLMVTVLRVYRLQIDYEKARAKYDLPGDLTKKDLENIEEAAAVNGQIRKHLSDLKKKRK